MSNNLKQKHTFDVPAVEAGEQPFIAQDDTMTCYECTLGQMIEANRDDSIRLEGEKKSLRETIESLNQTVTALNETVTAKNARIDELVEYSKAKSIEISSLKMDLGVARMLKDQERTGIPAGLERLPDGGIRLGVTLDVDTATPYLSQAESAGEDPAVYVQRMVEEAVLAFAAS
jgi:hypothetical protein